MKSIMLINTVSIILGIVAIAHKSITPPEPQEDHDIGPIQACLETRKTLSLSSIRGGLALAGRIVLAAIGIRAKE